MAEQQRHTLAMESNSSKMTSLFASLVDQFKPPGGKAGGGEAGGGGADGEEGAGGGRGGGVK
jgi:hypothetical protein